MAIPAELKFDVRVRERLVADGLLSETEVQKHLESLPDLEGQAVDLTMKQPALSNESDRDIVIVRTSGQRPPVAPIRPTDDDLPIPDDEDEDEEDDVKPEAKKPAEKPVEKPKAKVVEEEEEEEDDEDEDDDSESDKDKESGDEL
jgi:outer membrane biosynthesis protein TonB